MALSVTQSTSMGLTTFQNLPKFPPEIWASIIIYLSGEHLGRLKMTGSKLIWLKLCSKNVVKSVNLGSDDLIFKRWPAFLNEFRYIEELVIVNLNLYWCQYWRSRLDCIPKTLRKLKVRLGAFYSGLFFTRTDGSALSLADCVPELEYLDANIDWNSKITALAHTPQNLKTLKVSCYDGSIPLPASLTALKCHIINIKRPIEVPAHLESIETQQLRGMEHLIGHLPSCFRILRLKTGVSPDFDLIPKTCTAYGLLDFSEVKIDSTVLASNPASVIPLPSTLRSLDSVRLPSLCWPHLPPRLERLVLQSISPSDAIVPISIEGAIDGGKRTMNTYPIQSLPKSLTSLILTCDHNGSLPDPLAFEASSDPVSFKNPSLLFPPKLVYLSVVGIPFSIGAAQQLPPTLTSLEMSYVDHHITQHLPRGLTTLTAYDVIMSAELVKGLPKSLVQLKMVHTHSCDHHFDPVACEKMYLGVIAINRQRYPTVYEYYQKRLWLDDACLPASLTSLTMSNFDNMGDLFVRQRLPNLTFLDLDETKDFPDSSIPLLPRHLTYLSISESKYLSGKCFANLPKDLTYLNLSSSVEIYDDDIKYLPRTLRTLCISDARHLTNICIKDLPRGLSFVDLRHNSNITSDVFSLLPYKIRSAYHNESGHLDTFSATRFTVSIGKPRNRKANSD